MMSLLNELIINPSFNKKHCDEAKSVIKQNFNHGEQLQ